MYEPKPRFPNAEPWWHFDEECKEAEAELEQALAEAGADRDRVLSAEGKWSARDCVAEAANARYEAKQQSAQRARDEKVQLAQQELFKRLDEQEGGGPAAR